MKKLILLLVFALLLVSTAAAEMGVQIIKNTAVEAVSLDDLKLEATVEVDDFGEITLTACKFLDEVFQFKQGQTTVPNNWTGFYSGQDAEFLVLQADILNTNHESIDYLKDCTVRVIFNDSAEFGGWSYQYNWDNGTKDYDWGINNGSQNKEFFVHRDDQYPIDSWYMGHFCFGCTLPNAVVTRKEPLRVEITIGDVEMTYHIRK